MQITTLNTLEQEELNRISASLILDTSTKALACKLLCEYKQKTRHDTTEKLSMVVCCAILAASKSQIVSTVKGERVRGIGLSITQIVRSLNLLSGGNINSFELLGALKEFVTTVNLDAEVSQELKQIIERFAFSYTFYTKFKNIFKQLEIKESEEYINRLQNIGWLIFINARANILQNRTELVESVYLLSAIFVQLLLFIPESIEILYFQRNGLTIYEKGTKKRNQETIILAIAELLKINYNAEDYNFQKKCLEEYLTTLLQSEILKANENMLFEGMFDYNLMASNTRKLESYYQKQLAADDLDERFYLKERKANTPGKFTPFAKQGAANKLSMYSTKTPQTQTHSQQQQQQQYQKQNHQVLQEKNDTEQTKKVYHSHRVLNYEVPENVNIRSNLNEIKFTNKVVPQSPYTRLMPATPMTTALEMYNWLNEKVRKSKKGNGISSPLLDKYISLFPSLDKGAIMSRMEKLTERVLSTEKDLLDQKSTASQVNLKKLKDYQSQVSGLYIRTLEELLVQMDKKSTNGELNEAFKENAFHRALVACCIETVFFVNNNSSTAFVNLLEKCEIQAFDFWRVISNFVKSDPQIPFPIKKHLYDIEVKIITQLAWRKGSQMHQLVKNYFQESIKKDAFDNSHKYKANEVSDSPSTSLETTRLSSLSSESTQQESSSRPDLNHLQEVFFQRVLHHCAGEIYQLSESVKISDRTSESIWIAIKYILSSETNLLIDRHLTQLILCTVYGVCKVFNQPLKFQEIIAKYQELPTFNKSELAEIIYSVNISDTERGDLVRFYNVIYISQMKGFLFGTFGGKSSDLKSLTPIIKKPIIPALALASPLKESLPQNLLSMTLANQKKSPMLKHTMTPMTNALYAFGESPARGSEQLSNNINSRRHINFEDNSNTENNPGLINEAVSKIPKYGNSVMEKILEQKHEGDEDSNKKVNSKRNLFGNTSNEQGEKGLVQGQGASKALNFDSETTTSQNALVQKPVGFLQGIQKTLNVSKPSTNIPQQYQPMYTKPKGTRLNFDDSDGALNSGRGVPKSNAIPTKQSESEKYAKIFPNGRKDDSLTPEFRK